MGDEVISYEFVCQFQYPWICDDRPEATYLNNWYNLEYYTDYFTVSNEEAFDLKGVYDGLKGDVHPLLYYFFLHIMCCFFGYFTKWSGIIVNIVFFVASNIILYLISKKLIKSKAVQLIPSLVYGFSVGAISNVLLARMYMQLTFVTLLFIYLNILLLDEVKTNTKIKKSVCLGIFATTVFGVLTQYYFLIFAIFLCASIWIYFMIFGKRMFAVKYTITMFLGIICSYVIWPSMYNHIFHGYRGNQAFRNLKEREIFSFLDDFTNMLNNEVFSGQLRGIVLIILSLVIVRTFLCFFEIKWFFDRSEKISLNLKKKKIETWNIVITDSFF